jgi:hypothetical protein
MHSFNCLGLVTNPDREAGGDRIGIECVQPVLLLVCRSSIKYTPALRSNQCPTSKFADPYNHEIRSSTGKGCQYQAEIVSDGGFRVPLQMDKITTVE